MAIDPKIIERVKKLMAMAADSSSPNEAAIAARRARSLMDKHQINLDDLRDSDGFGKNGVGKFKKYMPIWENWIAVAIANYNDCQCRFVGDGFGYKQLEFAGFNSDVQVAEYMFYVLCEHGKRMYSQFAKDLGHTKYRAKLATQYKNSYSITICERIREMLEQRRSDVKTSDGKSLVIVKTELVSKKFGSVEYEKKGVNFELDDDSIEAFNRGRIDAMKANITTGLENENFELIE